MIKDQVQFQLMMDQFYNKVTQLHEYNPRTDYNFNFQDGAKKAEEVLEFLHANQADLSHLAYVSIGGADGSEIKHVLKTSNIRHGILMEFDTLLCKTIDNENIPGLVVLSGDAWSNKKQCGDILAEWYKSQKIKGVVIAAFSVMHELPFRSNKSEYRHDILLASIIRTLPIAYFYCKEPTRIFEWNSRLKLSNSKYCNSNDIHRFAELLKEKFAQFHGLEFSTEIIPLSDGVIMDPQLAGEVVKKLVYFIKNASVDSLLYEIGECHTALNPLDFSNAIKNVFRREGCETLNQAQSVTSKTFQEYFRLSGFKVDHFIANEISWVPNAFTKFEAFFRPFNQKRIFKNEESAELSISAKFNDNEDSVDQKEIEIIPESKSLINKNDFQVYLGAYQNEIQFALESSYSTRKKELIMHLDKSGVFNVSEIDWDSSIQIISYNLTKRMESLSKEKLLKIFQTLIEFNDGSAVFKESINSLQK